MNNITTQDDNTSITNSQGEIEKSRAVQEVQAMVLVAQRCPRDEVKAIRKILESAKRPTLAENALYAYPKGNALVKGASIRTAENIVRYWGNIDCGVKELSQDKVNKVSEVQAYAWDLETNTRITKTFQVSHSYKAKGVTKYLTDPRDIYEKVANDGARRLRACILGVIPSDVVEDFLSQCEKTLAGQNEKPIKERIFAMVNAFEEFGVTQDMIEKRLGCRSTDFMEKHLIDLRAIYKTIKDKMQKAESYFDMGVKPEQGESATSPFMAKNETESKKENEQASQEPEEQQKPIATKCANCSGSTSIAQAKRTNTELGYVCCSECEKIIKESN